MKVVVLDINGEFECHKENCRDALKKLQVKPFYRGSVQNHWVEENLAVAEVSFNEDLGINAGYEPPWVWAEHVEIYPCAKEG